MPTGPLFGIDRQFCAFISPVAELGPWAGGLNDIDVRGWPQR